MEDTLDKYYLPKKYWASLEWFLRTMGAEYWHLFPLVCDLSLQSPMIAMPKTEMEWRMSHPAWRFVEIVKILKRLIKKPIEREDLKWKYRELSEQIVKEGGLSSTFDIFLEISNRFDRLDRMTEFQRLMKAAYLFGESAPWARANPFLDLNSWAYMKDAFPAPLVQVGDVLRFLVPFADRIGASEMHPLVQEAIAEMNFQAFAAQLYSGPSSAVASDEIQCAYGYYNIRKGCPYQRTHSCRAAIKPTEGPPVPLVFEDGYMTGCPFEMFLHSIGIDLRTLSVDNSKKANFKFGNEL